MGILADGTARDVAAGEPVAGQCQGQTAKLKEQEQNAEPEPHHLGWCLVVRYTRRRSKIQSATVSPAVCATGMTFLENCDRFYS